MFKMNNLMQIIKLFIAWKTGLLVIALMATYLVEDFGGRFPYYIELLVSTGLPNWVWGFANFDGVHYINIARGGYFAHYSQAFFPLYPLLIGWLTVNGQYLLTGLMLSNIFLFIALWWLYKLLNLDYSPIVSFKSLVLLMLFPTAFYFGAMYSESLFLLLTVSSLWFMRKGNFILGGILAAFASATKIFGIILFLVLLIEIYQVWKKEGTTFLKLEMWKIIGGVIIAPLGLLSYMFYLYLDFKDPLYFLNAQPIFGAERTSQALILLPQVVFRYLKMIISTPPSTLLFFNVVLELLFTLIPLAVLVWTYKKIRFSYWFFTLACLILPTLTGTFSSMPRYALTSFLLFPVVVLRYPQYLKLIGAVFILLQIILVVMFIRGYWVA